MLDDAARVANYQAQNGGGERLTARQNRRVNKKRNHQSSDAALKRYQRSDARAVQDAKRAERASFRTSVQAAIP